MENISRLLSLCFLLYLGLPRDLKAQQRISGFVKDKVSGERLINAHVKQKGSNFGVLSNNNGYFSFTAADLSFIEVSYVGYRATEIDLTNVRDTVITVLLESLSELDEVMIRASMAPEPFVSTFNSREINQIPALGGKPDVIKAIQLLPGVLPQNEGSSRLIVRGGTPGENLFLIDNIPLIYVNHLGGFTSVFNADIIHKLDIYKGGFPSRYGGKLSSVIDITQREGTMGEQSGSVSIGITDASFTLEGPTKINNSSFIVTARKTMIDPLMALITGLSELNSFILSYGYHDFNGKFSWKPNAANSLHINFYQGDDYINYWTKKSHFPSGEDGRLNNSWGNWLFSTRWHAIVRSNLYGVTSLSYSRYRTKETHRFDFGEGSDNIFESNYSSSVKDLSLRSDWSYQALRNVSIDFGLQSSLFNHLPNKTYRSSDNIYLEPDQILSSETAVYLENSIRFLERSELNVGGRWVNYLTNDFSDLKLEPRARLKFGFTDSQSLNASYMQVNQFAHLLFTQGSINNVDVWVPAGKDIPPASSGQYSLGWSGSFLENQVQVSIDAYKKDLTDLTSYREGYMNLIGDNNWRAKVVTGGRGASKGIEWSVKKPAGNWTGFFSYTLSNTKYQFAEINNGEPYLFEYDKLHSTSISVNRKIGEKWSLGLTWIYQSGLPYTPAVGKILVPGTDDTDDDYINGHYEVLVYGKRNSVRMADYHRLDIGVTKQTLSKRWKLPVEWSFSLYNAYNRRNPYYYYYNNNSGSVIEQAEWGNDLGKLGLYQVSFFPLIPSVSYKLYFTKGAITKASGKTFRERSRRFLYHDEE